MDAGACALAIPSQWLVVVVVIVVVDVLYEPSCSEVIVGVLNFKIIESKGASALETLYKINSKERN